MLDPVNSVNPIEKACCVIQFCVYFHPIGTCLDKLTVMYGSHHGLKIHDHTPLKFSM